jgi:hypothetical protein
MAIAYPFVLVTSAKVISLAGMPGVSSSLGTFLVDDMPHRVG